MNKVRVIWKNIDSFLGSRLPFKTKNITAVIVYNDYIVTSYNKIIFIHRNKIGIIFADFRFYSNTTSRLQNKIKSLFLK